MPTFERAQHIQKMMGGSIYWDFYHCCYRVMQDDSPSLRRHNHYRKKA